MAKRMLVDATHPEETRVVVVGGGNRVEEFDFETSTKKQLKGNIYLARVTRVEPSLQAAFVEYGGNRHGFLAFGEIHPDYYRIPVADRQALLAAQAEDEREDDDTETAPPAIEPPDDMPHGELVHGEPHDATNFGDDSAAPQPLIPTQEIPTHDTPAAPPPPSLADALDRGVDHGPDETPSSIAASSDAIATNSAPVDDYTQTPQSGFDAPAGETLPATTPDDGAVPAVEGDAAADATPPAPPPAPLESVGGDEVEEVARRRRMRPMRHYKIQEVIKRRQILLVQVVKEERGTKGAALTTYLSLAGRYCVLMPNTSRGGGISRRITNAQDRKRLKQIMDELQLPDGMAVILRTAGMERSNAEIMRDYEYLMRLWDDIRELTLHSTAPCLVYEEGTLIKRTIRDLYSSDIDEILVEGEQGYDAARAFMGMLMPDHIDHVRRYDDPAVPLFQRFRVEEELDHIYSPTVRLRSGGYLVINQTEALVAIDVNSGRSTRERYIEETAFKTNMEAAEEVARQLRLRDLAGLIVIDFIDMEEHRNQHAVERRMKEAMRHDRARIQIGRISPFGLLELSRQRLRPSLTEVSSEICPHCGGTGRVRSTESTALHVLRGVEQEGMKLRLAEAAVHVPTSVALYLLNHKRDALQRIEQRYGLRVIVAADEALIPPAYRLDPVRPREGGPARIAAEHASPVRGDDTSYGRASEPVVEETDGGNVTEARGHDDFRRESRTEGRDGGRDGGGRDGGRDGSRDGGREGGRDGEGGRGRGRRRRRRGGGRDDRERPGQPHQEGQLHEGGDASAQHTSDTGAPSPIGDAAEGGPTPLIPAQQAGDAAGGHAEGGFRDGQRAGGHEQEGRGDGQSGDDRGPRRRRRGRRGGRRHQGQDGAPLQDQGEAPQLPAAESRPMIVGPGHDLPPESPFAAPIQAEPGRVEGPGDAHDWPWNRRAERFAEPPAYQAPGPTPAPAPVAPPRQDEWRPAAPVTVAPPRAPSAAPAPELLPPEPDEPKGPPRKGWWKRLTS